MIYSKNDETGGISPLPNHGGYAFTIFLKIFKIHSVDFTICWWQLCQFFKNYKSKTFLNFPFCHYQVFSKSTRGNERLQKEQYTIEVYVCVQLENLYKPIGTYTLSLHWSGRNTSG